MASVVTGDPFTGIAPPVSLPWLGTPGLPGASTNSNPGSIVSQIPFGPQSLTIGGLQGADAIGRDLQGLFGSSLGIGNQSSINSNLGQPSNSLSSGVISDIFLRAVIIILGFIFVAVGLSMFKSGDLNIKFDPLKGIKKAL